MSHPGPSAGPAAGASAASGSGSTAAAASSAGKADDAAAAGAAGDGIDIGEVTSSVNAKSVNDLSAIIAGSGGSHEDKAKEKGWPEQDISALNVSALTPLSPVIIHRQATINIGTIGHVAHGKSTVVKAISGVQTVRFKTELERNITIKLGYANAKIFKCDNVKCVQPGSYQSLGSGAPAKPNPGHDILMATMLNGAAVMDAALLLIAGNEPCPQPQTSEHLAAVEIMKLKNILIIQNKIDLVKEKEAAAQYEQILSFIQGTVADSAPIIPISAQLKYNIEVICEYICKKIPVPVRDFTSLPQLIVIRSFDVNKPGEEAQNLKGGVAGGSILKGVLRVGQEIEIRPGIITKDKDGQVACIPIYSRIVSLYAEHNDLQFAVPGGLIGVGTKIDPYLTRADRLVGHVLGEVGKLPDIFTELEISFFLLRRLLGVKTDGDKKKETKIKKLAKDEILMVNIGSTSTGARVTSVKGDLAKVSLTTPVCTQEGEKLALSRRVDKHWRLIGWGKIRKGARIISPGSREEAQSALNSAVIDSASMDHLNKEADEAGAAADNKDEKDDEDDGANATASGPNAAEATKDEDDA